MHAVDHHHHTHDHHTLTPSYTGTVVLDIGAGFGALILHTGPGDLGREIDLTPEGQPHSHRLHTAVRERITGSRISHSAVFPQLPAGRYTLWANPRTPAATVTVAGGHITQVRWPHTG